MARNRLERTVSGAFGRIGCFVGRHPWYFVVLPVVLAAVLASGVMRIRSVIGIEHLYAPVSGRTLDDKMMASRLFPMNVSTSFDLGRMTRTAKFLIVMVTPRQGEEVMTQEVMKECLRLDGLIRELAVEVDGRNMTYRDICAIKRGDCVKNDAGDLAASIDDFVRGRKKIKYPLFIDKATFSFVFYASILGGVKLDFEDHVTSARAIRFMYYLDDSDTERDRLSTAWDRAAIRYLATFSSENIEIKWFSRAAYASELKKVSRSTALALVIVLLFVIVFNFLAGMSRNWTQSKPWLSLAAVLCVLLSIAAAWGLCCYCGVEFASVVIFDFFLVLGLCTKDTMVLISAWRRTDPAQDVDQRLGKTYAEVFVSVTVTFLVSLVTLSICVVAPFRAAKIFCTYAAVTSLFLFLYEITFLGGCLALSGYREKKKLHPLICLTVSTKKSNRDGGCYRFCCTEESNGGHSSEDFFVSAHLWEKYVYFFQKTSVNLVVLLLYIVYLGVAAWRCTQLQVTSGITDPFPAHSYVKHYYDRHYEYFTTYPHRVQLIFDSPMNYSDPVVQNQVEQVIQSFENSTYASNAASSCWLRIYLGIINQPNKNWLFRGYDYSTEDDFVDVLGSVLLKMPMATDLATDVIFNEDQTRILTSRCFIQTHNIRDAQTEKMMLEDLYRIAKNSPIPVRFTSMLFRMYELATMIRELTLWTLPISFGVVLLVYSLFIPSIPCVLSGALAVLSVQVGVLGFSNLWGVKINSFYAVVFVMLVGLISAYIGDLAYAFCTSEEESSKGRMVYALKSRASVIVHGTVLLVIAPAFLLLTTNHVSTVFYKMFFLVVVFSCFHALVVLPVLYAQAFGFQGHRNRDSVETCQMDKMAPNREPLKT